MLHPGGNRRLIGIHPSGGLPALQPGLSGGLRPPGRWGPGTRRRAGLAAGGGCLVGRGRGYTSRAGRAPSTHAPG